MIRYNKELMTIEEKHLLKCLLKMNYFYKGNMIDWMDKYGKDYFDIILHIVDGKMFYKIYHDDDGFLILGDIGENIPSIYSRENKIERLLIVFF